MALISGGILVLMWILGHHFSGHYKRLALISVDIISGVYCTLKTKAALIASLKWVEGNLLPAKEPRL